MTSATFSVERAGPAAAETVTEILTAGFLHDPVFAWMLPDPSTRPAQTRAIFEAFAPFFLENGDVYIDDQKSSVALWVRIDPADASDDPALAEKLAAACGPYVDRLEIVDALMKSAHPHHAVHDYLNFVATVPERQGAGIGRRVLDAHVRQLDATGTPGYLEATTLRSAALYSTFGFKHLERTIELPQGPSMYPMWREPRQR